MDRKVTREELLARISELLADVEAAISKHSASVAALYYKGRDIFVQGQTNAEETEWSRSTGLTLTQLGLIHHYLFANAFMSAWYDLDGDKQRRDEATQPACLLVSGLGFPVEDVMKQHLKYESAWRSAMQEEHLRRRRRFGCLVLVILIIGVVFWLALK